MKLTEELLEWKFPASNKRRLAARRATTRSEEEDEEEEADVSSGREWPSPKSLISSSKCASSAIRRTRSVQSFLNNGTDASPAEMPEAAGPALTTSRTRSRSTTPAITPPAIPPRVAQAIWLDSGCFASESSATLLASGAFKVKRKGNHGFQREREWER